MRYHFGYPKAEVIAMPWYDSWAHREYMLLAREEAAGESPAAPRSWNPDEALPVEDGRPTPWNPDASPLPTSAAASRPRPTARRPSYTAEDLGLEPGTQVTERDGDAAALRSDGFTVLTWN